MRPDQALRWLAATPILLLLACQQGVAPFPTELEQFDAGGDVTVRDATSSAFSLPAPNLTADELARHLASDRVFEATFVSAPAPVNPGLGPVFNNNSCVACHKGDGGGRAPEDGASSASLLFRLSMPGATPEGGPAPVPGFGGQLQDQAIFGLKPEAKVVTTYMPVAGTFADGMAYSLRKPTHTVSDPYRPLPDGVMLSPRLSSPVFGLGLLEAVPEEAILQRADEADADGDGISGRPNHVWDARTRSKRLGRFGWKANVPTLEQQVLSAYQQDMGLTSELFPEESSAGQPQAPASAGVELSAATVDAATFYVRTLGVPARRDVGDERVRQGARLFRQLSCATCHAPTLTTGPAEVKALAYQVVHPYTDLLLHDMGPELADNRPDFEADGREWRTAPLWGLGLRQRVEGHQAMLHDGRARGAEEAILWHGGEAEAAREGYKNLSAEERSALQAFLMSL